MFRRPLMYLSLLCMVLAAAAHASEETAAPVQAALALEESTLAEAAGWVVSLETPDLDGDGRPDVLAASYRGGQVFWLRNNGGGVFGAPQVLLSDVPGASCAIAADLDNDGDLDVVASAMKTGALWRMTNLGNGRFSAAQTVVENAPGAGAIEAADLDADGDIDLALASWDADAIGWLENRGADGFVLRGFIDTDAFGVADLAVGDLNADGVMELVSACWNGQSIKLHQQTAGTYANTVLQDNIMGPTAVMLVDLDGDGRLDLLNAATTDDRIGWIPANQLLSSSPENQTIADAMNGVNAIDAADFDNDGDLDILAALYNDGRFVWIENQGGGVFGAPSSVAENRLGAALVRVADMNGDGKADLVTAEHKADTINLFLSDGHGLAITTRAVCPESVLDGEAAPLLQMCAENFGSEDTPGVVLRHLRFRLHDADGNALDASLLASVIKRLALCLDDGDGTFALGPDVPVAIQEEIADDGIVTLELPLEETAGRIAGNQGKTFFLVADIAADASLVELPALYVTHLTPSDDSQGAVVADDGSTMIPLRHEDPVVAGPLAVQAGGTGIVSSVDAACVSGLLVKPGEALQVKASVAGTGLADIYAAVVYDGATFVLSGPMRFAEPGQIVPLATRVRLDEGASVMIWDTVIPDNLPDGPLFWVVLAVPTGAEIFSDETSVMDTAYCEVRR